MFYLKLALSNLKKANSAYFPFILSSVTLFVLLNTVSIIWLTPDIQVKRTTPTVLGFAFWVIAIFSFIIVHYSYNFLLKQRTKEFGLYSVLGMNRKRISLIATLELVFVFLGILLLGSLLATVLSKFLYLVLVNLMQLSNFDVQITSASFFKSLLCFAVIFGTVMLMTWLRLTRLSSLELLKASKKEEKEPRGNGFIGIVGVVLILASYIFSFKDIQHFDGYYVQFSFLAVVSVIIGTYLFFISFLSWFLKKQKENPHYFYNSKHFIPVSNMLYRMKQNALGLANITILATMVMATLIGTASFYYSTNEMIEKMYSTDKNTYLTINNVRDRHAAEKVSQEIFSEIGASSEHFDSTLYFSTGGNIENIENLSLQQVMEDGGYTSNLYLISMEDYETFDNPSLALKAGEVAVYQSDDKSNSQLKSVTLLDNKTYSVKQLDQQPTLSIQSLNLAQSSVIVVLPNEDLLYKQSDIFGGDYAFDDENAGYLSYSLNGSLTSEEYEKLSYLRDNRTIASTYFWSNNKDEDKQENLDFTGPFLFIGVLIGTSFLLGACLIMYYKQLSEGYEDKKSYKVLQEVGMSQQLVKKTINGQILLVFFAPLLLAVCHVVAALPLLNRFISQMGPDFGYKIYYIAAILILVFVLLYYLVYRITSRIYYRIIER
ncbi:ABC transporter permease [Streptococcus cameli]